MWLTTIRTGHEQEEQSVVKGAVQHYRQMFFELEPRFGVDSIHKSILLIFPDASPSTIEQVQRSMKSEIVGTGLMLGEFHPYMTSGARHNPHFHALRSPVPMLVIRTMVEADLEFLLRESDPVQVRTSCVESYLRLLGRHLTRERRQAAETALRELRSKPAAEAARQGSGT